MTDVAIDLYDTVDSVETENILPESYSHISTLYHI